jgi:hypothetical protein
MIDTTFLNPIAMSLPMKKPNFKQQVGFISSDDRPVLLPTADCSVKVLPDIQEIIHKRTPGPAASGAASH